MSVLQNINGTLYRMDASDLAQLAAVDTEGILGGTPGATTNGQTLVDQLAADDVQAQTDIGQIKTDLSDDEDQIDAILNVYGSKNLLNTDSIKQYGIGLSISVADDGTMTITGTEANASGGGYLVMFDLPAGTYIFSGLISGGSSRAFIDVYENKWTNRTVINENGAEKTLTFTTDTDHVFRFFAEYNATVNVVIKPMLRDSRIKDSTYVPYAMTNRELTAFNSGYNFIKFLYAADGDTVYSGDLNDLHAGYVYFSTSASNIPVSAYGYCLTLERPTNYNYAAQIAVTVTLSNLQLFVRQKRNHTWESWKTVTLT